MVHDRPYDDVTTANEFERALGELPETAARNGIHMRGSWEFRDLDAMDHEVLIVELKR